MGALAFVVLQSQTDANAVVADVLADAVAGRLHALSAADGSRLEVLELAARHIRRQAGGTGRGAVAPLLPDATEIGDAYALRMALMDVSTVERLLLGLQHLARLTVGEMAAVMRMSPGEVRERLDDARNRVQALTERNGPVAMRPLPIDQAMSGGEIVDLAEHAGPQGRAVMSHGHSPFDRRLSEHLRREAGRYVRSVSAADVDAASVRHRETRRAHRSGLLAIALVVAAIIVGVSSVLGASAPAPSVQAATRPSARPSAAKQAPPGGPVRTAPISLADCDIEPADSSLAWAGWATLDVLHVQGASTAPGAPVYAVVTRGLAEWVGWRASGGAMYPPPVGRMGCVYDPTSMRSAVVGIPMDWQPPATSDGCPVSPRNRTGSYQEAGGPNGWLILPAVPAAPLAAGGDSLSFRLSPPPNPGQSVSAWAQHIDGGLPITAEVTMNPSFRRPAAAVARSAQESGFYTANLVFSSSGCWVVDMAINGNVVGSAVVAIRESTPSPRTIPFVR